MSTVTVVETTTEEQTASEQSSDSQTLDEQRALYIVYDDSGTPCVVDAQGFEVVDVASTNLQGNLQHCEACQASLRKDDVRHTRHPEDCKWPLTEQMKWTCPGCLANAD